MKLNDKKAALTIVTVAAVIALWLIYESTKDKHVLTNTPSQGPIAKVETNPKLGKYQTYLTDAHNFTLYISLEHCPDSSLDASCLDGWVPYLVNPDIPLDTKDPILQRIGTVLLPNNIHQYTYLDYPLFYYMGDRNAGDVNGHNIANGNWVAVLLNAVINK